jgi:hypothetical protein
MRTTYRANKVITLIVTCLGFFMVLLNASIVNMALIEGSSQGWTSALILSLFTGSAVLLAAILMERGEQA